MLLGICGKPSVGKSSFFRAATLAEAEVANYPFTTIKPNSAMAYVSVQSVAQEFGKVPNPREGFYLDGMRFVPVELLDVAGLVAGAHEGKGLGNTFLGDLIAAHVLIHVVDISGSVNASGEPVDALSYDPLNDIAFLEHELDMWFYSIIMRGWERFARQVQMEQTELYKAMTKQLSGLGVTEAMALDVCQGKNANLVAWTDDDVKLLARELRQRAKPMVIAANKVDVPGAAENLKRMREKFPTYKIIPCSAESELALREAAKKDIIRYVPGASTFAILQPDKLNDAQKKALDFIQTNILDAHGSTGVQQILDYAVFDLLHYVAVFPGGVNNLVDSKGNCLPDCFLMKPGTTALQFAFRLHQDIGNAFVKAIDVRSKKPVGKDHVLKHRDIIEIKTS